MWPEQNPSSSPASGKLYSRAAITLATFLGAPLAGCTLMAINYRRLGKPKSANAFLIGGALSTAVLAVGSVYIPDRVPPLLIPLAYIYVMYGLASTRQWHAYQAHLRAGGGKASLWAAVGIGLASMIVLAAFMFLYLLAVPESWLPKDLLEEE